MIKYLVDNEIFKKTLTVRDIPDPRSIVAEDDPEVNNTNPEGRSMPS